MTQPIGPLTGVKVLDFSAVLSGPMATALLADQGAEVLKIEPPEGDTTRLIGPAKAGLSAMYITANRGKRVMTLDLKRPEAQALARRLIEGADVLVENMRPGVMARLGLGPAQALTLNPRLIYVSITGFGADGPDAGARVYDTVVQARSGFSAANPHPLTGEPMLLPATVCDKLTALTAAQAVSSALVARARTGLGQHVEVAMIDAAVAFQWPDAMYNHVFLHEPPPAMPEFAAGQRPWATQDGFVATNTPQQAEFDALCRVLGCADMSQDARFSSTAARMRHGHDIRERLSAQFACWRTDELVSALVAAGVPVGRVNQREDLATDAQLRHNGTVVQVDQPGAGPVRLARSAARFGGQALPLRPAPTPRQHTREVLGELGIGEEEIEALVACGAVFAAPP